MRILLHDYAGHAFPVGLSRQLAERGHVVTHAFASQLLTPRGVLKRRDEDTTALSFAEVPMSSAYRANKYSFIKRLGYERAYGWELMRLAEELKPDVILSGQTPSEPQLGMIRAATKMGIPVVTWVQDFYSMAVDKLARKRLPLIGALAGAWYRRLDAKCFEQSSGIVAITEDFLPILDQFGVPDKKVTVIPNWAPLDELPLRPRVNGWAVRHGLVGKFVFLYSGTLAMKHNPELLHQLAKTFMGDLSVRVVVISEGPGADYLRERQIAGNLSNLVLLPFQDFGDMPDVLASADVLLSVLEADAGVFSVPSKVLTYHAAGRPILGAMPAENLAAQIIQKQGSGICVPPDDCTAFLEAAESLHVDSTLCAAMGRKGRAYAEKEFDIDRIADCFESVFAQALSASSRRLSTRSDDGKTSAA